MRWNVYHFSGVMKEQNLGAGEQKNLDFTSLQGTDLYCDPESEEILAACIRKERQEGTLPALRFFDSGNYHYMSKILAQGHDLPVGEHGAKAVLIVLDHHTDMQPSGLLPILSCGSWVWDLLQTEHGFEQVISIGPPEQSVLQARELLAEEQLIPVTFVSEEELAAAREAEGGLSGLVRERISALIRKESPIYLSVDKDVLSKEVLDTTWDQGILSMGELEQILRVICSGEIAGGVCCMDVCGEPESECSELEIRRSEAVNQKLLGIFSDS